MRGLANRADNYLECLKPQELEFLAHSAIYGLYQLIYLVQLNIEQPDRREEMIKWSLSILIQGLSLCQDKSLLHSFKATARALGDYNILDREIEEVLQLRILRGMDIKQVTAAMQSLMNRITSTKTLFRLGLKAAFGLKALS